jgi:outer membrane lipoprotein SlyB
MKTNIAIALALVGALGFGCADMGSLSGPRYGDTGGTASTHSDRQGSISSVEYIKVDEDYKLGIGTVVGAVAGGLLGSQIGAGRGATVATIAGAVAGGAGGTVVEGKIKKRDAQRVTVRMQTGGQVTIVQPVDGRLKTGMSVLVQGSGESARVVPR